MINRGEERGKTGLWLWRKAILPHVDECAADGGDVIGWRSSAGIEKEMDWDWEFFFWLVELRFVRRPLPVGVDLDAAV